LAKQGVRACIPVKKRRRKKYYLSERLYAHRHTVENAFARLKRFKRVAIRSDKLGQDFSELCPARFYSPLARS
jgi:transposase